MQRPRTGSVGRLRVSNNSLGLSSLSGSSELRPSTSSAPASLEDTARRLLSRRPLRSRRVGAGESSESSGRDYESVRTEMMRTSLARLRALAETRFGSMRNLVAAVSSPTLGRSDCVSVRQDPGGDLLAGGVLD